MTKRSRIIRTGFVLLLCAAGWARADDVRPAYLGIENNKSERSYVTRKNPLLNGAPITTADWTAESGQKWKVPVGAGFGKLAFVGKLPINTQVGAYTCVVRPDFGPDWQLRIQIQTLFPKPGDGS